MGSVEILKQYGDKQGVIPISFDQLVSGKGRPVRQGALDQLRTQLTGGQSSVALADVIHLGKGFFIVCETGNTNAGSDPLYKIIDGNHRFQLFSKEGFREWLCQIISRQPKAAYQDQPVLSQVDLDRLAETINKENAIFISNNAWDKFCRLGRLCTDNIKPPAAQGGKTSMDWEKIYTLIDEKDQGSIKK